MTRDKLGRFKKGNQYSKGHKSPNKILDAYTDLPISRQRKHQLRNPEKYGYKPKVKDGVNQEFKSELEAL